MNSTKLIYIEKILREKIDAPDDTKSNIQNYQVKKKLTTLRQKTKKL